MGRSLPNNADLDVGNPLLLCEVGQLVGPPHSIMIPNEEIPGSKGGPDLGLFHRPNELKQRPSAGQKIPVVSPILECPDFANTNFGDESVMPTMTPPVGFLWQFLAWGWAVTPASDCTIG